MSAGAMITNEEHAILQLLAEAWNAFVYLETQHPDELQEFRAAIHAAQGIIATRVARAALPDIFPTVEDF